MVGPNGMDNLRTFAMALNKISTNNSMATFNLMVHGLTNIMQESSAFGVF